MDAGVAVGPVLEGDDVGADEISKAAMIENETYGGVFRAVEFEDFIISYGAAFGFG